MNVKRVYDSPEKEDGFRVLVDRIWPRGLSKEKVKVDLWLKEIAPSTQLRKWFAHDPKKWESFILKYERELKSNKAPLKQLMETKKNNKKVTLHFAAKDELHNNAVALKTLIENKKLTL